MTSCADEALPEGKCEYWDEDGCYCICGAMCACEPFTMPDPELERILSMSDDEILAEVVAAGDDPDQIARDLRAMFEDTLKQDATPAEPPKDKP